MVKTRFSFRYKWKNRDFENRNRVGLSITVSLKLTKKNVLVVTDEKPLPKITKFERTLIKINCELNGKKVGMWELVHKFVMKKNRLLFINYFYCTCNKNIWTRRLPSYFQQTQKSTSKRREKNAPFEICSFSRNYPHNYLLRSKG